LAVRWAAKEAVAKAFGTGIGDISFKKSKSCAPRASPSCTCTAQPAAWPKKPASPTGRSASATPARTPLLVTATGEDAMKFVRGTSSPWSL
jgi:hypothetical protein